MFAVLPLVGGVLLGWLASRRVAILVQIVFVAIASAVIIGSAPDHGHTSASLWWLPPVLLVLGALSLLAGFWIADRRAGRGVGTA
jgi:hypothetical protein